MMTADGTSDDLIKLEGLPLGHKYKFAAVELDDDAGSDADNDDVPGDEPARPVPPAEDAIQEAEFEEVANEPDDLEYPEVEFEVPDGMQAVLECPTGSPNGRQILYTWDRGWTIGTVKSPIRRGQCNYGVQYNDGEGSFSEYRQSLTSSTDYPEIPLEGHRCRVLPTPH